MNSQQRLRPIKAPLGPEQVANGTFDNGTGWSLTMGWSIGSGKLNATSGFGTPTATLTDAASLAGGKTWRLTLDVLSTSGNIEIQINGVTLATITAPGNGQSFDLSPGTGGAFRFRYSTSVVAGLDNVSIREVL